MNSSLHQSAAAQLRQAADIIERVLLSAKDRQPMAYNPDAPDGQSKWEPKSAAREEEKSVVAVIAGYRKTAQMLTEEL